MVKQDFKEYFSQYVLIELRTYIKQLRTQLHNSDQEHIILKKLEEIKKLIHSMQQFYVMSMTNAIHQIFINK